MNIYVLMPLAGLTLWLAALYIDSKFSFRAPSDRDIASAKEKIWWKSFVINHAQAIKYGALFLLWLAISIDVYLRQSVSISIIHYGAIILGGLSIAIYALAQAWRFL